jgi:hypothetical protein
MSELDDAMREHMDYIVSSEGIPFCYKDFLSFKIHNKDYGMKHGTFRNKICALIKSNVVELDYNSGIAFYTLKGHRFGKRVTPYHTVVSISHNDPVYNMIKNLPMDKQSIHAIHLKLKVPNIYKIFSVLDFPKIKRSQDIVLPAWCKNNSIVKVTIHKTDTVTVIIGCSLEPIPLDYNGIIRFFTIAARSEGFLEGLTVMMNPDKLNQNQSIPEYRKWLITRWDFGRDSLQTYKGKNYETTIMKAQHFFERIYTKDFGKYKKIRHEHLECPGKTVIDAIQEKLNENFQT